MHQCIYCGGMHYPSQCRKYATSSERHRRARDLHRCTLCLGAGHSSSSCTISVRCYYCRREGHHRSMCLGEFGERHEASGSKSPKRAKNDVPKGFKRDRAPSKKNASTMTDSVNTDLLDAQLLQAQQEQLYELASSLEKETDRVDDEKKRIEASNESLRIGQELVAEVKSALEDATKELIEERAIFEQEKERFSEEKAAFEKQKAELESERSAVASLRSRCEADQIELSLQKQCLLHQIAGVEKREKAATKVINDHSAWVKAKTDVTSIEQALSTAMKALKKLQDRCNKHAHGNQLDDDPTPDASPSRRRSLQSDDLMTSSPAKKLQRRSV